MHFYAPRVIGAFILAIFIASKFANAAGDAPATAPATRPAVPSNLIHLTIHPAAIPRPALKYRFLPDAVDQISGNAAPLYLYLFETTGRSGEAVPDEDLDARLHGPIEEVREDPYVLGKVSPALEAASLRTYCHWELPFRQDGFATLLPHLNGVRRIGRLNAIDARMKVSAGHYAEASRALMGGTAMARNLNDEPFLIQSLVACGVESYLLDVVDVWVSQPDSPNLYWALTELPSPFCDLHASMQLERVGLYASLPHLKEAATGHLSAEHWDELTNQVAATMATMGSSTDAGPAGRAAIVASAIAQFPKAKQFLLDDGFTAADLEAMQPFQVIAAYWVRDYDSRMQEISKWSSLPYSVADARISEAFPEHGNRTPLQMWMPAIHNAFRQLTKLDRRIAALRVIEAIRAYAAGHAGHAPATLDAVTDLPIPNDPMTGSPFKYDLTPAGFVLSSSGAGMSPRDELRYEAVIEK